MKLVAALAIAAASLARDPWTGIEDRRDLARARAAARLGDRCEVHRRSARAKATLRKRFPCPSTGRYSGACSGWVVDHIVALKHCGRDTASNMAWQTVEDAERKDRWE